MRILNLRFKNLNSLVGEWEIDLTHPAYVADGLFAITGPTGAGKTTLLDAICLALYGRTPRLDKVTKSENEIMSRHTGECFAEVTFETQAGRYRCHWSQHRARRKPDGALQQARHEIADLDSGSLLETSINGVAGQVEAATGMDFDRFTRSMLLAQGGFAAFLQAPADERAPILEQITGTEIYSQISIRVHERCREEQSRLNLLQAELAGMQTLSSEAEAQLREDLERRQRAELALNGRLALNQQALAWREGLTRLEGDRQRIAAQREDWRAQDQAFAPERVRLGRANQALELTGPFANLAALRRAQDEDRHRRDQDQAALPQREAAVQMATAALSQASARLDVAKANQDTGLPLILKARELDLRLAEQARPIATAAQILGEQSLALVALRDQQRADETKLTDQRRQSAELETRLAETQADAGLLEVLNSLQQRFEGLRQREEQRLGKEEAIRQARTGVEDAARLQEEAATQAASATAQREDLHRQWMEQRAQLHQLLDGLDLPAWRQRQTDLSARRDLLAKAVASAQALWQARQALADLGQRERQMATAAASLAKDLSDQADRLAGLEKQRELLETQLRLLEKIQSLAAARKQLRDGEPCPLCGALEHPFALGNMPVPDETRQELQGVKEAAKATATAITGLQIRQAGLDKDRQHILNERDSQIRTGAEAQRNLAKTLEALVPAWLGSSPEGALAGSSSRVALSSSLQGFAFLESPQGVALSDSSNGDSSAESSSESPSDESHPQIPLPQWPPEAALPDLIAQWQSQQEDLRQTLEQTTGKVATAEAAEKALARLRDRWDQAKDAAQRAEGAAQAAGHRRETAQRELERLQMEAVGLREERDQTLAVLVQDLQPYGPVTSEAARTLAGDSEVLDLADLDRVQAQLSNRRDQRRERQDLKLKLDQAINTLQARTTQQAERIQAAAAALQQQQALHNALVLERDALARERHDLFGDRDPAAEEGRLAQAIAAATQVLEDSRRNLNAATQARAELQTRLETLEQALQRRGSELDNAESAFRDQLQSTGFSAEEDFLRARLTEEERKALARQDQSLAEQFTALSRAAADKDQALARERDKRLTDASLEALTADRHTLEEERTALLHAIGGLRQRLQDHDRLQEKRRAGAQALETQRRECQRWEALHKLIGSADGRRYRNFVQGLTFRLMIGHANRQLRKMSDRYLLIHDVGRPLELSVIDNYQAGEVRSTKNLSGGESFIVSLALALGLSQMASRKVRVDSLFLDEGFGTLDEEALDTALATLAGLRQDGKLIGVISHVATLKERIATQIQVIPLTGGRGRLAGPGCKRLQATHPGR